MSTPQESGGLSSGGRNWLSEHLNSLELKIKDEARNIATNEGRETIEPKDISRAALKYAPGIQYPDVLSFREKILSSISGVTIVSAILVVVFGIMGVWRNDPNYLDIVKIFAGAIVGSTGTGVVTAIRRK